LNRRGDELGEIIDLISRTTRFMRSYLGEVIDDQDPLGRGRVKVSVPELGWASGDGSPWADPEYMPALSVPPVGSFVVIRFMAGDASRPMYGGRSGEVDGAAPQSLSGPSTVVLLDEPSDGGRVTVTYDRKTGGLSVSGAKSVSLNGDSKRFVTHSELDAALQSFISALNLHTHLTAGTGPPSPPTVGMAIDISAAATETVKTGG